MVNQNTGGEQQPYITNTSLPYPTYQAEENKTILPYKTTTIFDKYRQHNQQLDTKYAQVSLTRSRYYFFPLHHPSSSLS